MIQQHQQLETYTKWSGQIAASVSTAIGIPDGITANGVILDVDPSVPDAGVVDVIVRLGQFEKKSVFQSAVIRWTVGRMVLELCARSGRLETEVIEEMELATKLALEPKTILNWCSVSKQIPPSMLKPGVSWNCLASAAVRLPDDPIKVLAIREAQDKALEEASANPVECTGAAVRSKVHAAMEGMGLKPPAPVDKFSLLLEWALLLRRLRHLDETQDGSVDRIDLVNAIEEKETSLINLQVIAATV